MRRKGIDEEKRKRYFKEYFHKRYWSDEKYRKKCKQKALERFHRKRESQTPIAAMLQAAKIRAKQLGIEFDLNEEDVVVPTHCPILGIPLKVSNGQPSDGSYSMDRIHNDRGYVRGNVIVVSWRANVLKRDATLEELKKLHEFYSRFENASD